MALPPKRGQPKTTSVLLVGRPWDCAPHLPVSVRQEGPMAYLWAPFKLSVSVHGPLIALSPALLATGLGLVISSIRLQLSE